MSEHEITDAGDAREELRRMMAALQASLGDLVGQVQLISQQVHSVVGHGEQRCDVCGRKLRVEELYACGQWLASHYEAKCRHWVCVDCREPAIVTGNHGA